MVPQFHANHCLRRAAFGGSVAVQMNLASRLLCLLGDSSTVDVPVGIGNGVELTSTVLDTVPNLACNWGGSLGTNEIIDARLKHGKGVLDMAALRESSAQECGVDGNQDPRPALEENGRQEKTNPEKDLEARDNGHGHVVVLLDKAANSIRQGVRSVLGLSVRRSAGARDSLGRDDGGDQVRASVGCNVEDGVDAVGQHSKRVLGHEEPDKGHDCAHH